MKTKIITFLFLCSLILVACASREERQIKNLQRFTVELKTNSDKYTDAQWQQSISEFERITESLKSGRYTDEERREIREKPVRSASERGGGRKDRPRPPHQLPGAVR